MLAANIPLAVYTGSSGAAGSVIDNSRVRGFVGYLLSSSPPQSSAFPECIAAFMLSLSCYHMYSIAPLCL